MSGRPQKKQRTHPGPQARVNAMVNKYQPSVQDQRIYPVRLTNNARYNSNVGGIINTPISMNPNGSTEWANCTSLYDEFRVRAIRIRLVSLQQYSVTAANNGAAICYDNDNTTALTSQDAGLQYNTSHLFPAVFGHVAQGNDNKAGVLEFVFSRPTAGANTAIPWIDVAAPANSLGSVKFYCDGLTASTAYWQVYVDWFVEFRGRQ